MLFPASCFQPPASRFFLCVLCVLCGELLSGEQIGVRPYELDWANRTEDEHPALVNFENLDGWKVECREAEAKFERTREQQIWGQYVGKLTYRGTGNNPQVKILPPAPVKISAAFDAVTCWIYGNNWGWTHDPETPQVSVAALFDDSEGKEFSIPLAHVNWTEWHLCHRRLTPEQIARVNKGAAFKGFTITGGKNQKDRALFFDNLAVFTEKFEPLSFQPRPERGIAMFPGQSAGANTGPGKLPFPTRPETILPSNLMKDFKNAIEKDRDAFLFKYDGSDGKLVYRFWPRSGMLTDITAQWVGHAEAIVPCAGGGIRFQTKEGVAAPRVSAHLGTEQKGETVESRWQLKAGETAADVTYVFRIWGKSLVVDVLAPGGLIESVQFGRATGLQNPRLVTVPYYLYGGTRPAIVVSGQPEMPLFLAGHSDWCLSNASTLWAANAVEASGVTYNGGTRYIPKTDGKRNDCFERFFITVSPRFEEVLPNIPNPVSPWKKVTGTRVWRAHGASNREADVKHWTEAHRYGMTELVITDHETMWRDGGESFTFRTKAAPKKGGDEGAKAYSRTMQDKLGFVYGPYNNFTDFAPVNEFWSTDMVSRSSDNQLQHAWMRCYAPKPARAVEYCAKLSPINQSKFGFSTAYCDVHTAVTPWERVDYDARVSGAGTFAAVFYSFGEIMLLQKEAWKGPVYSEGNNHFEYCGLTDGNYAQDQNYRISTHPWLVDFDLLKLHELCCNFGMGNPDMFYCSDPKDPEMDRFLAATVAFGHPGFLMYEGGMKNALKSYYMLQQLHSRYALSSAKEIRYADAKGKFFETSAAIANGVFERSQIVTRYSDGTITGVNGHPSERLVVEAFGRKLDLPPNGYAGWTEDGKIDVFSGDRDGHRCDFAFTPAYIYVDGRGEFTRFHLKADADEKDSALAASNGIGICRILPDNYEIVPFQNADCGFAIPVKDAVALDKDGKELGPATLRVARGLTYVLPVQGAFSYKLSKGDEQAKSALKCERDHVVPGEKVTIRGKKDHVLEVPQTAKPGARIWQEFEKEWIDFTVVPLVTADVGLDGNTLKLALNSHLAKGEEFTLSVGKHEQKLSLKPGKITTATVDLGKPETESDEMLKIMLQAGEMSLQLERALHTRLGLRTLAKLPERWRAGMRVRGQDERFDFGESHGYVRAGAGACGGVSRNGLTMHPPYQGGVGYSFALYDPQTLPKEPAAFRAYVGKIDGGDLGDGILYKVAVVDDRGEEKTVSEQTVTKHEWLPIEADLSPWAGKRVSIKLIADVGVKDNSSGDWACWAEMRIEDGQKRLIRTLEEKKQQ
ncbi:MAG TPA: hypothetical protein VGP72_16805 [Planctomycetota bacterium]|jgi:hypothetical protein